MLVANRIASRNTSSCVRGVTLEKLLKCSVCFNTQGGLFTGEIEKKSLSGIMKYRWFYTRWYDTNNRKG